MLKYLLKLNNMTPSELARQLDVSVTQIYKWDKQGISEDNPHWKEIHRLFPSIQPRKPKQTKSGLKDNRTRSGKKKKKLILTDTSLPSYAESEFKSKRFPNIRFED